MKKTSLIIRFVLLNVLMAIALVCFLSEPAGNAHYVAVLVGSKILGAVTLYAWWRLLNLWGVDVLESTLKDEH